MIDWLSIYILAPISGWFLAHVVKFAIQVYRSGGKNIDPKVFFESGGMPSSHTAIMVSTLTVLGVREGVGSAVFGLAAALTAVVVYDALNVRRSVGEQGDVLSEVATKSNVKRTFLISRGHTPTEVVAGAVLGLLVGSILLQIL